MPTHTQSALNKDVFFDTYRAKQAYCTHPAKKHARDMMKREFGGTKKIIAPSKNESPRIQKIYGLIVSGVNDSCLECMIQ